jgi:ribonuclease R
MANKKPKVKGKKLSAKALRDQVMGLLSRHPGKQFNPKQIAKKLKIENNKDSVLDALQKLAESGSVVAVDDYRFKLKNGAAAPAKSSQSSSSPSNKKVYEGYVDMTRNGDAYIVSQERENDIHVAAKFLNSALNGDIVQVTTWKPRGRRVEGEVIKVLKRVTEHFMGTLKLSRNFGIVIPDSSNMPVDIIVFPENLNGAKENDKVVVKVEKWHDQQHRSPVGLITSVLGAISTNEFEMKSILVNNGFPLEFPPEVLEETEDLPDHIPVMEINRREDLREVTTFTIDPEDAKDFDDAISFRKLEDDAFEIGVHIADVSHYVKPGSALDLEAFQRSTSVYLVDRVLPMLPEKISNELCSLRPNEDKLTFSAIFKFDKNHRITSRWFGRTVIHSDHRFTYEQAQEVMDSGKGDFAEELEILTKVARKLRKDRFKRGSIDFDSEEVRFRLAEDGTPLEVYVKERKEAHLLIEDFMLLANREVAAYVGKKGKSAEIPFVYRVHDLPDPDKVAELARFAKEMGFQMKFDTPDDIARSYNKLTKEAKKNDHLKILEPIAIRTMAKAEYVVENIGHYGLGFEYYTHFTSPIRRYSDVLVHRILDGNLGDKTFRTDKSRLEAQCKHISMMERKAMEAERESTKYKQVEFIQNHLGENFKGVISGIIDRGLFVELKGNKCEGMIGFEHFPEPFEVDPGRLKAVGKRTGKTFKMGDDIEVKVVGVDLGKRQIDMELVSE